MEMLQLLRVTPDARVSPTVAPAGSWGPWSPERTTRTLLALQREGVDAILLATCHRLECYWWGHADQGATVRQLLAPEPAVTWHAERGDHALRHLMRVAAGLESERRGEPEILGQLRAAWRLAIVTGTSSPSLDHTIRGVISAARQLRRRLGFTDGAALGATIGAATIALVAATWRTLAHVPAAPRRWLVVGSGAVGTSVAEALRTPALWLPAECHDILWLANRTPARAYALAARCGGEVVAWDAWPRALPQADVVIFAAHTAVPLVSMARANAVMAERTGPTLWVDLGAPLNCEPGDVHGLTRRTLRDLATGGADRARDEATAVRLVDRELARWHQTTAHRQRWYDTQRAAATSIAV
jgi:glutamyl-tRNA reductase